MHAHYYTLICNWCHFLNLIFCNVRFSHPDAPRMCVCVCVCVGGGGGVCIYVGWDHFGGFKILNFNILGGFRNISIFGGMKILWIYHNKIGLVLEVISIHFRDFRGFLKVNVQDGDIILGSPKLQIFFGVWLIIPIYFGGRQ